MIPRPRASWSREAAVIALCLVGIAGEIAEAGGWRGLRDLCDATQAAPRPTVFSDDYSLRGLVRSFTVELVTARGERARVPATASLYADLPGPYERRLLYGA